MRFGRKWGRLARFAWRYKRTTLAFLYARWLFHYVTGKSTVLK